MTQANHAPAADDPRQHGRFMASHALVCCLAAALIGGVAGRAAASIEHIRAAAAAVSGVCRRRDRAVARGADAFDRHSPSADARRRRGGGGATRRRRAALLSLPRLSPRLRRVFGPETRQRPSRVVSWCASGSRRRVSPRTCAGKPRAGGRLPPLSRSRSLRMGKLVLDGTLLLASAAAITVVFSRGPYGKQALDKDGEQPAK